MDYAKKKKTTEKGAPLKKLRHITCPYTGIQMISGRLYENIVKMIRAAKTTDELIHIVSRFTKNMQEVEATVFEKFLYFHDFNPKDNILDFFNEIYNESLNMLILEELKVLDEVDRLSQNLSPATQLKLRSNTTDCRRSILDGMPFKRKTFIETLSNINCQSAYEEKAIKKIEEQSRFLPSSSTSPYAFVVKYADRSETEIFERFIKPSIATIEHICPSSVGGDNKLSNFMLASLGANKLRENMSLELFVSHFPDIPEWVQLYIDEIKMCIKRGELQGYEDYPANVAKTLQEESLGRICIKL